MFCFVCAESQKVHIVRSIVRSFLRSFSYVNITLISSKIVYML